MESATIKNLETMWAISVSTWGIHPADESMLCEGAILRHLITQHEFLAEAFASITDREWLFVSHFQLHLTRDHPVPMPAERSFLEQILALVVKR